MKLTYKILSLFGLDVENHITFKAFILGLFIFDSTMAALLLVVFAFVTAHEFTHSIVAKMHRIKVEKIIILPIGGMAVMNIARVKPLIEVKIALAGPMFNFLMCYILILIMHLMNLPFSSAFAVIAEMELSLPLFIYYSFYANLVLGTFNFFIPAFPLDGGRVLRAVFALKMSHEKATRFAKNISLAIAALMFVYAYLNSSLWIMIIAGFIAFGAIGEYKGLLMHKYLRGIKAKDVLSNDFLLASKRNSMKKIIEKMYEKRTIYALLKEDLTIIDLRTITDLTKKPAEYSKKVPIVKLNSKAELILIRMNKLGIYMFPVVEKNKLIGVVKRTDIERLKEVNQLIKNKYQN